jgi:hypothetical protein
MSDATKVRVEVQRGRAQAASAGPGPWPGAKLERTSASQQSVLTHRPFRYLTRGQSGALGPRERGMRFEPRRHTGPGNRALQHGELVSEQGDLGEQRPARAKRVRQGGGEHQRGFEHEGKGNADALDFSLIPEVAMTGSGPGVRDAEREAVASDDDSAGAGAFAGEARDARPTRSGRSASD